MADPVAERIAVVVKTRLGLIDGTGSYQTTAAGVQRPQRIATFQPKDFLLVVTQQDITKIPELSGPGNPPSTAWSLPFEIAGILRQSETDSTPSDTYKNKFWADVVKALTSVTNWHSFGGLAINADIGDVQEHTDGESGDRGFKLILTVTFRTSELDPTEVRA